MNEKSLEEIQAEMAAGVKTPEELDHAADLARTIAERVMFSLGVKGYKIDPMNVRHVILRETIQGVAQDVLLFGPNA